MIWGLSLLPKSRPSTMATTRASGLLNEQTRLFWRKLKEIGVSITVKFDWFTAKNDRCAVCAKKRKDHDSQIHRFEEDVI